MAFRYFFLVHCVFDQRGVRWQPSPSISSQVRSENSSIHVKGWDEKKCVTVTLPITHGGLTSILLYPTSHGLWCSNPFWVRVCITMVSAFQMRPAPDDLKISCCDVMSCWLLLWLQMFTITQNSATNGCRTTKWDSEGCRLYDKHAPNVKVHSAHMITSQMKSAIPD